MRRLRTNLSKCLLTFNLIHPGWRGEGTQNAILFVIVSVLKL